MNLLLDEMLSVRLPEKLARQDLHAAHVVHRGLAGNPDHAIWQYANENDFTVVTVNAGDYLRLAARTEIHAGVIVIRESGLDIDEQLARIMAAVHDIRHCGEDQLVNHVVEVLDQQTINWIPIPPT